MNRARWGAGGCGYTRDRDRRAGHVDLVDAVASHAAWTADIQDRVDGARARYTVGGVGHDIQPAVVAEVQVRADESQIEHRLVARSIRNELDRRTGRRRVVDAGDLRRRGRGAIEEADVHRAGGGVDRCSVRLLAVEARARRNDDGIADRFRCAANAAVGVERQPCQANTLVAGDAVGQVDEVRPVRLRLRIVGRLARFGDEHIAGTRVQRERGARRRRRIGRSRRWVRVHAAEGGGVVRGPQVPTKRAGHPDGAMRERCARAVQHADLLRGRHRR